MKQFEVPIIYRSPLISAIKKRRKEIDKMKKDFTPTLLDLGSLHIYLARHFGFCYGVENAIEIAFRTVEENPNKRIFFDFRAFCVDKFPERMLSITMLCYR